MLKALLFILISGTTSFGQSVAPSNYLTAQLIKKASTIIYTENKYSCPTVDLREKTEYFKTCPSNQQSTGNCYAHTAANLLNCQLEQSLGINPEEYIAASFLAYSYTNKYSSEDLTKFDAEKAISSGYTDHALISFTQYCSIKETDLKDNFKKITKSKLGNYLKLNYAGQLPGKLNLEEFINQISNEYTSIQNNQNLEKSSLILELDPTTNSEKVRSLDYYSFLENSMVKLKNYIIKKHNRETNIDLRKISLNIAKDLNWPEKKQESFYKILFPKPILNEQKQYIRQTFDFRVFFEEICQQTNKKVKNDQGLIYIDSKKVGHLKNYQSTNKVEDYQKINMMLTQNNPKPIGLAICSEVLKEKPRSDLKKFFALDCANHTITVIGQKWNSTSNKCEYLIRNSWGTDCSDYYSKYKCVDGDVWIPAENILRETNSIQFFE